MNRRHSSSTIGSMMSAVLDIDAPCFSRVDFFSIDLPEMRNRLSLKRCWSPVTTVSGRCGEGAFVASPEHEKQQEVRRQAQ